MVVVHPVCVELCVSDVEGSLLTGMCVCGAGVPYVCASCLHACMCVCVLTACDEGSHYIYTYTHIHTCPCVGV